MLFETEDELRKSFIERADVATWSTGELNGHIRTVIESTCSEGRADWVWAHFGCNWHDEIPDDWSSLMRQPSCSRLIAYLLHSPESDAQAMTDRLGYSRRSFQRYTSALLNAQMIEVRECGSFSLSQSFRMPETEICSFEFKLENWRRAFNQAKRYRAFSHRVYVVMPSDRVHRAEPHLSLFEKFNIGLISHAPDGTTKQMLRSEKREPETWSNFIQAIGLLLD